MRKHIWISIVLIALFAASGYFLVQSEKSGGRFAFHFGLDLVGGTELIYRADTSGVSDSDGAMESLKGVIERRVNIFGVSEPLVQTEKAGILSGQSEDRLIVGLPGVTDIEQAIALIGETPILEFRLEREGAQDLLESNPNVTLDEVFADTGLSGRYLSKARVEFNPTTGEPIISIEFDDEGRELFAQITKEHKDEVLAIVLDGVIISAPVIIDEITNGNAQISGAFTPEEARDLVRDLNYGALPVPIELATSQTVGATLGAEALYSGVRAGLIGLLILAAFLILWYRLPGLVSGLALGAYVIVSLAIFKLVPVTLTAAGVAGFILSIGMAVDANILIFERTKEELKKGKSITDSLTLGFKRAWLSIRDSNISSIITAIILFWLGTSAVKGFALTFGIGVLVSMFSAISVSRTFLLAVAPNSKEGFAKKLFMTGISK